MTAIIDLMASFHECSILRGKENLQDSSAFQPFQPSRMCSELMTCHQENSCERLEATLGGSSGSPPHPLSLLLRQELNCPTSFSPWFVGQILKNNISNNQWLQTSYRCNHQQQMGNHPLLHHQWLQIHRCFDFGRKRIREQCESSRKGWSIRCLYLWVGTT